MSRFVRQGGGFDLRTYFEATALEDVAVPPLDQVDAFRHSSARYTVFATVVVFAPFLRRSRKSKGRKPKPSRHHHCPIPIKKPPHRAAACITHRNPPKSLPVLNPTRVPHTCRVLCDRVGTLTSRELPQLVSGRTPWSVPRSEGEESNVLRAPECPL